MPMNTINQQEHEHLRQLKQAVEIMQLGVVITDLDGNIIYTNHAEAQMHGYQEEELLGHNVSMLAAPEYRSPPTLDQLKVWKGLIRESINVKKDGTTFPVRLMSEIVINIEATSYTVVTSCEDISERKQAEEELRTYREHLEELVDGRTAELQREIVEHKQTEEALRKSEERHRIILESAPDPVVVYDMEGRVQYLNRAFSRVFGWTLSEIKGQKIDFVPGENLPEARLIFTNISHGETISGLETCRLTRDGQKVDVSVSGAGFFDSSGRLQGSVITIQDITERKRTEEEIKFIAYHDVLTGLPNRKSFYTRLEDRLIESHRQTGERRRTSGHKWALLFLDMDQFKYVNDTLGHDIGDDLLKSVAARLQTCVRKSDCIFRLGGDEFTIILNDISDDSNVVKVAKKIQKEIGRPCNIKDHSLYPTVSIGISLYPDDGEDVEVLVKKADMAMYAAKEERGKYRFFTEEIHQKTLGRLKMESSLRTALQQNQFIVYYQPLVDTKNQVIGMEALIRWNHPELGVVGPSQFIPLAEETGAIIAIGKWVLQSACVQTKHWHNMGYTRLYVSVNLSGRQFKEPDLVEVISQALETAELPPDCLKLEITESSIMENPEQAIATMKLLKAKGIRFSIDDFGTGYSSLSYLKHFPIDTLKIDRSFVMDSTTNKDDQEILKTILAMAKNLEITTIAEGVETKEQLNFLVEQGCHFMQGYYFGWPMPANRFEEMLNIAHALSEKQQ